MFRSLIVLLGCIALTACISQQSYLSKEQHLVAVNFDRKQAAKARLALALSYLKQDKYQAAKLNLDRALRFAPNLAEVHSSRAYYFQKLGDYAQAEKHYQAALKISPDEPNLLHNYGSFLCYQGQFSKAKSILLAVIELPNYAFASRSLLNLAYCSLTLEDHNQALNYLQLAIKYQPDSVDVLLMLAGLNFAQKKYSNALGWYQKYQQQGVASARGLLLGILLYQELGMLAQVDEVKEQLFRAFKGSSESQLVKANLTSSSEYWRLRQRIEYLSK